MSVNPHAQWWLLAAVLILTLCGCSHKGEYTDVLVRADSLASANPDSAIAFLRTINPSTLDAPSHHYYDLLCIKANDKAFVRHTSDSLVLDALHYFEGVQDRTMLPEAYYYAGRVTSDLGDAPQAMGYYQKALDVINQQCYEPSSCLHLQAVIYAQMGYLFQRQHLYDNALFSFRNSLKYDSIADNKVGMLNSMIDIGRVYQNKNKPDSSTTFFFLAEDLAKGLNDNCKYDQTLFEEIYTLCLQGRYDEAKSKFDLAPKIYVGRTQSWKNFVTANLYSHLGMVDSAAFFYSKVLTSGSAIQRVHANMWFANQKINLGDVQSSIEYLKTHILLYDSLNLGRETETVGLVNALYNYQLREKENHRMQIESIATKHNYNLALFALGLMIIGVVVYAIKRQKKSREQYCRLHYILDKIQKESEDTINANKAQINLLKQKLANKQEESKKLLDEIDKLEMLTQQAQSVREVNRIFNEKSQQSTIFSVLDMKANLGQKMLIEEVMQVEEYIQMMNPGFVDRLRYLYNFSEIEWQVTLLIKMNFSQHKIAVLTCLSEEGVSSVRRRLVKKVLYKPGSPKEWNDFIASL